MNTLSPSLGKFCTGALTIALATILSACAHAKPQSTAAVKPIVTGYGADTFTIGDLLYESDFSDKENWELQIQKDPGAKNQSKVKIGGGVMDLYMPATGCTAWLKKKFSGPITITYEVKCPLETINGDSIQARDINNFWHCSDPKEFDVVLNETKNQYNGGFGSYHEMQGYYASTGGGGHKGNRTTRFRRYPRQKDGEDIPHIALNDRDGDSDYMITAGKWHTIQLVANDGMAQYIMDGKVFYEIKYGDQIMVESHKEGDKYAKEQTYTREAFPAYNEGYFGFRLVRTHHQYRNLKIHQLEPTNNQ